MYILALDGKQILNSDFAERFCICEKEDAALIVASYGNMRPPITVARYRDDKEARDALYALLGALGGGQLYFIMPDSTLYYEEPIKKDARTKRKGGS